MQTAIPATDQDNAPLTKAGAVISGVRSEDKDNPSAQQYVVAPYTEGRFGANDKYYVLAKGGIDKGETVLDAAIREASEETGIHIGQTFNPDGTWDKKPYLLDAKQIERLRQGQVIADEPSGYAGVRIRRVGPEALDFAYNSRENKPHRVVLMHIDVEGIDHLHSHLKNPENRSRIGQIEQVHTPLRTLIRNDNYPRFEVIFEWLRSMRTPEAKWAKKLAGSPLAPTPDSSGAMPEWFEKAGKPGYFANLEAKFKADTGDEINDAPSWQNFLAQLPADDYENMLHLADLVKDKLVECKVLKGDSDIIKFDTKDLPFFFYQEGADILTKEQYLKSCIDNAASRGDFARAFAGNNRKLEQEKASRIEQIEKSQIAGVVWAAGEHSIDTVIAQLKKRPPKTRNGELWGKPINQPAELDDLGADLHTICANMKAKEVPLTAVANLMPKGKLAVEPTRKKGAA
jgi:8-oxo-dGTP pyrophosphatase MutT (NUDIX family)